jgi:uncharacterized protein (DUF1697 family)
MPPWAVKLFEYQSRRALTFNLATAATSRHTPKRLYVNSAPATMQSEAMRRSGADSPPRRRRPRRRIRPYNGAWESDLPIGCELVTRYAAFLRGVNVGGVNLKMADVAAAFADTGFAHVRTILASGNVILESPAAADAVRAKAETALRRRFGYDAWVLVYGIDTVRAIVDAYPFEPEVSGQHSYVTFVTDTGVLDELAALAGEIGPDEKITRGPDFAGLIYWQVPKNRTLDSTIGKTMGKKRYKSSTTTRNLRTLAKVLR